ncbi:hypothetical protein BJY00DRAFT_68619 [Aspergillus carlsbadensis]|nr:hypothetical protein BJY00DRAFT_68619 [Aspergillus carlsbadensis]
MIIRFSGVFQCQTVVPGRKTMAQEGSLFQGERYPSQSTYSEDDVLPPTNARIVIRPYRSFRRIAHSGDWRLGQTERAKCCVRIPIIPVGIMGAPSCQLEEVPDIYQDADPAVVLWIQGSPTERARGGCE